MAQLQQIGTISAKERTLQERLNDMSNSLGYQCERIETVLARVNSTPQNEQAAKTPAPQFGLGEVVGRLEDQVKRLSALADNVERIA